MAARSKAWFCGLSHAVICGFEGLRERGSLSFVRDVCRGVEGSASGWWPVERGPAGAGVSDCDREASVMRQWLNRSCCNLEKISVSLLFFYVASVITKSEEMIFYRNAHSSWIILYVYDYLIDPGCSCLPGKVNSDQYVSRMLETDRQTDRQAEWSCGHKEHSVRHVRCVCYAREK